MVTSKYLLSALLLVVVLCGRGQQVDTDRLSLEFADGQTSETGIFSSDPARSGARSAYKLAPFGEGFGFVDLFSLFSQRDTKQSGDGLPFQLDDSLISKYMPIVRDEKATPIKKNVPTNLKSSITKARRLQLLPWSSDMVKFSGRDDDGDDSNKLNQTLPDTADAMRAASPVILVPGYGGSRLEAKLDKPSKLHYFCDSKTDWTDLWINVKQLLPYMIDCLIDNMRLEFDPASNRTQNPAGVDIRVKNGSKVESVEYLNNMKISGFAYFAPIIEQLIASQLGYERELNIRAAPYDFRKAPNELGEFFNNLRESSEQLVRDNNGRAISFICHSMGCNNMLYFLHHQTEDWKRRHVRRLISLAAPWAGSVSAMRAAAVGDDLGMPYLFSESKLLLVQRSLPSTIFLFPNRQVFSGIPLIRSNSEDLIDDTLKVLNQKQTQQDDKHPGIEDESKTNRISESEAMDQEAAQTVYTADDFKRFFQDTKHPDGYRMWLSTKDLLGSIEAPGVEVWCLVGVGKRTLARIDYVKDFPTSESREIFDDGDGTVTIQSADYCKRWSNEQQQPVYYKQFQADHLAILKNADVLQFIAKILDSE